MDTEKPLAALVVGAGPVGLVAACELARRGVRFRIVDKMPEPSSTSKALAIFPRTLEVFESMGIASQVISAGQKLHGISIHNESESIAHLSFDVLPGPYRFAISLPQSQTERILTEHLQSLGVAVERNVELIGFAQNEKRIHAILRHVGAPPGQEERLDVPWLIGCDGAHSTVRHLLGEKFEGSRYDEAFILADVQVEGPLQTDEAQLFFSREGILGIFPFGGGRGRVIANLPRQADPPPELTLAEIQTFVDRRGAFGLRVSDAAWISRFNISHRIVRNFLHGRVFMAGDAAHIHSPVGGQGMNTGIQDAFNLAWKLALVIQGRSPLSLLASYSIEREPVARGVLYLTDRLTRMATTRNAFARQLRNFVLPLITGSRRLEEKMAERMAELNVHYRESPIVEDYSGEPLRAGDRAPDAVLVEASTGKKVRLFERLRNPRHTLLLFAGLRPQPEAAGRIGEFRRQIETAFSEVIAVQVIGRERLHPATLVDESGMVHTLYDADAGGIVLVRPDGYLGFRSDLIRARKFWDYLGLLFPLCTVNREPTGARLR